MLYAFSRDGAVPFSKFWHYLYPTTKTPVNAVWGCVFVAFLLGLPVLNSAVVFFAVTSIATIGLYVSYAVPIVLRITVVSAVCACVCGGGGEVCVGGERVCVEGVCACGGRVWSVSVRGGRARGP